MTPKLKSENHPRERNSTHHETGTGFHHRIGCVGRRPGMPVCRFVFVALFVAARWPLQRASWQLAASTRRAQACENGLRCQLPVFCDFEQALLGTRL